MTEDDVRTYAAENPHLTREQNERLQRAYKPLLEAAMTPIKDQGPLAPRLRAYADAHPGNDTMNGLADDIDSKVETYNRDATHANMKRMIGAVARARLHWCRITGESLV